MPSLNSRYYLIIITVFLNGCFQSKKLVESFPIKGKVDLQMVESFKTFVDTAQRTIHYKEINLEQIIHKDTVTWIHNQDSIFIGNKKKYELLFEIYDSSFLVISYVVGTYPYFGPGVFRRDNLVFYDLNTGFLYYTATRNIFIAHSRELFKNQNCLGQKHKALGLSRVIDSIDMKNNKLIFLNRDCQREYYNLKEINKPYIID